MTLECNFLTLLQAVGTKQRGFGMFVSTVGGGEGSALTVILPVRHTSSIATSPPTPSIYKKQ